MTRHSRGFKYGTRRKLEQKAGYRPTITKFLRKFEIGQDVVITIEPSSHKGMPFPRFKGKTGKIIEKRGRSYVVEIRDYDAVKKIISRPEHLTPM
ncbi:MAG TPA: 50S ribosomal protein L21e [archaeon]|nr:50S ribosomal protein L21e [archaeon]